MEEYTEKYITFTVPTEKQVTKKLQKIYVTLYSLLIAQNLWQARYQIFLIIYLKEIIELNVNEDMRIKTLKDMELHVSIATVSLIYKL